MPNTVFLLKAELQSSQIIPQKKAKNISSQHKKRVFFILAAFEVKPENSVLCDILYSVEFSNDLKFAFNGVNISNRCRENLSFQGCLLWSGALLILAAKLFSCFLAKKKSKLSVKGLLAAKPISYHE